MNINWPYLVRKFIVWSIFIPWAICNISFPSGIAVQRGWEDGTIISKENA